MKTSPLLLALLAVASVFCILPNRVQAQMASQLYADAVQTLHSGDVAGAKHQLELALEIDKNFRPASVLLDRINAAPPQQQGAAAVPLGTLQTMSFPVEFKDTSLSTALEYIRQQVEKGSGGRAQVNFVLQLPPELANRKVTLQLNHVPVMDVLHYLGDLAGVSFQVQKYAIAVVPAGATAHP